MRVKFHICSCTFVKDLKGFCLPQLTLASTLGCTEQDHVLQQWYVPLPSANTWVPCQREKYMLVKVYVIRCASARPEQTTTDEEKHYTSVIVGPSVAQLQDQEFRVNTDNTRCWAPGRAVHA